MSIHKEKLAEAIQRFAAQFLSEEANQPPLITVMRCEVSNDLKSAIIFVTILPNDKEEQTLSFLRRKRSDMRRYIQGHVSSRIPTIDILLDEGEKHRQRIDELI